MAYPCVFCNAHMFHVVTSVSFPSTSAFQKPSGYSHILPCVKWVFYMPTAPNNIGWMEWVPCLVLSCLIFVWMCFLDWGMWGMYGGVRVHVGLLKKGRKKILCYKLFHNFVWYRSIYFVAFFDLCIEYEFAGYGSGLFGDSGLDLHVRSRTIWSWTSNNLKVDTCSRTIFEMHTAPGACLLFMLLEQYVFSNMVLEYSSRSLMVQDHIWSKNQGQNLKKSRVWWLGHKA